MHSDLLSADAARAQLWSPEAIEGLLADLLRLRAALVELEQEHAADIAAIPAGQQASARNLLHYVALRNHDIRDLQDRLTIRGLSSLGRCEGHVLDNVEAVTQVLARLAERTIDPAASCDGPADFQTTRTKIDALSSVMFGEIPADRSIHIMVTMPPEAAHDLHVVRDLVAAGMDTVRINCAHDDADAWLAMIRHVRLAEQELGRRCKVMMDLGGPKIRTGPIEDGPAVVRFRPERDAFGRVVTPARIWLSSEANPSQPPHPVDVVIPLAGNWLDRVRTGETLELRDASGRPRTFRVVERIGAGLKATCDRTVHLLPGLRVRRRPVLDWEGDGEEAVGHIGQLPPLAAHLVLRKGDRIQITRPEIPGRPARLDEQGKVLEIARIGCTLPEVFADIRSGQRVLFDDGKIAGRIIEHHADHCIVEITRAAPAGAKLRSDKGMNFPDSNLRLPALTDKDLVDLEFVAAHADGVNYSFVRRVDDITRLQTELARLGRPELPIVLKIENRQAFERLPRLLLAALKSPHVGVMIARGDLAVECGFERTAELQEEILWLSEAAHLPVIWATQVLETLAKKGLPTRAEITDASMGVRAECVMLNKGPHIVEAVRTLDEILRRMQHHQVKKRTMLRKLKLVQDFFDEE